MKMFAWMSAAVMALSTLVGAAQVPPPAALEMAPLPEGTVVTASTPIELFHCVRYKDLKNIHPCAVPMIVSVPDPCPQACGSCGPQCVYVKVCVPPCDCYETKCKRRGNKLVLDFGDYEVEITSARGEVVVDYDD